jgi:hypothetical protein
VVGKLVGRWDSWDNQGIRHNQDIRDNLVLEVEEEDTFQVVEDIDLLVVPPCPELVRDLGFQKDPGVNNGYVFSPSLMLRQAGKRISTQAL